MDLQAVLQAAFIVVQVTVAPADISLAMVDLQAVLPVVPISVDLQAVLRAEAIRLLSTAVARARPTMERTTATYHPKLTMHLVPS